MIHQLASAQDESEVGIDFSGNTDFVFLRQFITKLRFLIHTDPFSRDCVDRYYSFQSHEFDGCQRVAVQMRPVNSGYSEAGGSLPVVKIIFLR